MKKTLFAFMALAATFAATSCQSDEELTQQPTDKPMVINAVAEGIGTGTRATMAYKYDIFWNSGDQIHVKNANSTKNAAFTLKTGEGTTDGTFECQSSPFTSGEQVEAYYPASLVNGGNLVWPAQQTTSTVVPMYSKNKIGGNGAENFTFSSLGAMLQIVFNTEQAGVTLKSITLKDGTNPLSGTFTVDANGKALMAANTDAPGITYDLGTGKSLGKGANFFYIAVPAGTYSNLSITFTATDNTVCTLKLKEGASITLDHNTVGRLTLTGTKFKAIPLSGLFSVSATKKVRFSKGNLWADSNNALHFEANQYSFASTKDASHVSYFTWSSTVSDAVGNTNSGDYLFCDEFHKVSVDGSNAIYYALSKDEWDYLIKNHQCKWVTVNNVSGLVIAPDGFTGTLAESYTDDAALATDNLVFLPAAGCCLNGSVSVQGTRGHYWSSTPEGSDKSYDLRFVSGGQAMYTTKRDADQDGLGYSVRLVVTESTATTGTAKAMIDNVETDVNWVQLWEYGPKFAEYNVGVTDGKAESYGGYYFWGGSQDKVDDHNTANTGSGNLTGTDDTATKLWGSNWRMPTQAELQALLTNCDVQWTTVGGVSGKIFTGKEGTAYASNRVFLPAVGGYSGSGVVNGGSMGCYWSSTPSGSNKAYYLYFNSSSQSMFDYNRSFGYPVRAVLAE